MSEPTSVHAEVLSPFRFDRTTLVVRILLAIALGWLGVTAGWLVALLFLALPLIAAISILAFGTDRFRAEVAPTPGLVLMLVGLGHLVAGGRAIQRHTRLETASP